MATLTGQNIANTYKQLLQIGSDNAGLTASVQTVQDGSGTNSALQLSQSAVNINGTFQLNGTTLTATASALNAVPDITAYTGFIAVSGTNINGRTLTGGTGVSISNADGTEGNPVIALNTTGVTSGTYGPATNFEVNAVGQVVSAGVAASVSVSAVTANTFVGGTFEGTTGNFSSNVSVGGNLIITGDFTPAAVSTSAVNATAYVSTSAVNAATGTFSSTVSAAFFVGDGSGLTNVPSAEGGTVKRVEAGQGIRITVDGAVSASIPVSGTVAVSADQNFGTVSVSTALAVTGSAKFGIVSATNVDADELLIAGVSAATVTEVAAVSALTQVNLDSITSINTVVANVSAVTSVNAAAITSINAIIGDGGNFATSAELAAVSAALATSIGNSNTNITTNANAITSINTVVAGVSALTSVNAAAITSINTVVANVSALTSVNAAAITSINAVIEGDVSADSGTFNTLTVITSASIGGTLNVGGNTTLGDAAGDVTQNKGGFAAQGTGLPGGGSSVEINFGLVAGEGTVQAFDRSGSAWEQLRLRGSQVAFDISGTEKMRIDSGGNVGIGTTSVSYPLVVYRNAATTHVRSAVINPHADAYNATHIYQTTNRQWEVGAFDTAVGLTSTWGVRDDTAAAYRMVINSSGNVGIGQTSPSRLLEVLKSGVDDVNIAVIGGGSGAGGASVAIGASGTSSYIRGVNNGVSGYVPLNIGGSITVFEINGSEKMRIDSSGNVGVGETPNGAYKLQVNGNIGGPNAAFAIYPSPGVSAKRTFSGSNNSNATLHIDHEGGYNRFGCDNTSQHFAFTAGGSTSGDINVVFKGDGNVGIGTTSPAKQLEITKSARATITSLTDGATITPDFDAAQNFAVTLGGNRTLANPSNIDPGQTGSIFVVQDGTGGRTLSFGSYWKFAGGTAPTMSTGAAAVDRIDYVVYTSTAIHAVATLNLS